MSRPTLPTSTPTHTQTPPTPSDRADTREGRTPGGATWDGRPSRLITRNSTSTPEPTTAAPRRGRDRRLLAGAGRGGARGAGTRRVSSGPGAPARQPGRVVSLSAVRGLAGKARQRQLTKQLVLGLVVAALLLGVVGYAFLFSPWLAVRHVTLIGGDRFGAAQLDAATAGQVGRPLARVNSSAVERAIGSYPAVKSVRVVRVWPGTLEVRVTERVPVLAVPVTAEPGTTEPGATEPGTTEPGTTTGYALMAADGVVVETIAELPEGIAATNSETVAAGPEAVQAAAAVMAALPPALQSTVTKIGANSRDSVLFTMVLPDGDDTLDLLATARPTTAPSAATGKKPKTREVTVVWGSVDESALKAEVLAALLTTDAGVYDVSSPSTPVTRDGSSGTPTLDTLSTPTADPEPADDKSASDESATGETASDESASDESANADTQGPEPTTAPTSSSGDSEASVEDGATGDAATVVGGTAGRGDDAAVPVP